MPSHRCVPSCLYHNTRLPINERGTSVQPGGGNGHVQFTHPWPVLLPGSSRLTHPPPRSHGCSSSVSCAEPRHASRRDVAPHAAPARHASGLRHSVDVGASATPALVCVCATWLRCRADVCGACSVIVFGRGGRTEKSVDGQHQANA